MALSLQERIGHTTADQDRVDLLHEVLQNFQFAGNLRAADDGDERTLRFFNRFAQIIQFFLHQEASDARAAFGLHILADGSGGGVVTMGRAERVVDIDIAVAGELLGHGGLLLLHFGLLGGVFFVAHAISLLRLAFFGLVEAGVFQHQDFAGLQGRRFRVSSHAVSREFDFFAKLLRQIVGDGLQAEFLFIALAAGAAKMAHQNQSSALFQNVFDRRQSGLDAGIVRDDLLVVQRNVEVNAHHNFLAFHANVFHCLFVHLGFSELLGGYVSFYRRQYQSFSFINIML